jgi:hypothetical protein
MIVRIMKVLDGEMTSAEIRQAEQQELPSMHSNWRFNFDKLSRSIANATAYVLVSEETPNIVEGCLIFQMKDKVIPYMAYVEVAPHNRTHPKRYDTVGGCLIAFACSLSHQMGKGDYCGWLTFDVQEEQVGDQLKLMAVYSKKYHAYKIDETTMLISPEDGERLMNEYLDL